MLFNNVYVTTNNNYKKQKTVTSAAALSFAARQCLI